MQWVIDYATGCVNVKQKSVNYCFWLRDLIKRLTHGNEKDYGVPLYMSRMLPSVENIQKTATVSQLRLYRMEPRTQSTRSQTSG